MKVTMVLMALVGLLVAGCGGQRSTAPPPNKAAQDRAVAFYKAYYLHQDPAAAWDMTEQGIEGYETKSEYVKRATELFQPAAADTVEVSEYPRVNDYLYLISSRNAQVLVWVTKAPDGWKVYGYQYYRGGPIPWEYER